MKNTAWIIIFAAVCSISAAVMYAQSRPKSTEIYAQITSGGKIIRTIPLGNITEPYEFTVRSENGGTNKIRAEKGRICVSEADCPDKVCVHQGYIHSPAVPIVCLPNKLVINIVTNGGEDEYDSSSGGVDKKISN